MMDIDIADLISWALIDQNAGYFCERPTENRKALLSSTAIVTGTLMLGVQVDCQPGFLKRLGAKCHPDAVTVYEAIMSLPSLDLRALLLAHGRSRTQPDWSIWPELKPKRHVGNHRVVVESSYDQSGTVTAQWCPLEGYPSMEVVAETRARYSRWRAGLIEVKRYVSGYLSAHRVTGPSAPSCPWLGENATPTEKPPLTKA